MAYRGKANKRSNAYRRTVFRKQGSEPAKLRQGDPIPLRPVCQKSLQPALGERRCGEKSVEQNNSLQSGEMRCKDIAKRV
jgi:formylmethanofuran dehydrogenase subunit E